MTHFKSQAQLVQSISENLEKLEAGQLSLSELEAHVQLTRELYERTIVLRYKAFESEVGVTLEPKKDVELIETPSVESPFIEIAAVDEFLEEAEEETPSIDFSLFDTEDEDEMIVESEVSNHAEEIRVSEPEVEVKEIVVPIQVVEPVVANADSTAAFVKKFTSVAHESSGQFGLSKLDTLVGSFGLNERLQYINELFDGSSETFSEAIKSLDSLSSIDEAKQKTSEFAVANQWDLESDTVIEFIQKLCRRYV